MSQYPDGVTERDHIAHDMRMGRFPQQSSIETFLSERHPPAAEREAPGGVAEAWYTPRGGLLEAQRIAQQAFHSIEAAKRINGHVPGNPYDVALSALNSTLAELSTLLAHPPAAEREAPGGVVVRPAGAYWVRWPDRDYWEPAEWHASSYAADLGWRVIGLQGVYRDGYFAQIGELISRAAPPPPPPATTVGGREKALREAIAAVWGLPPGSVTINGTEAANAWLRLAGEAGLLRQAPTVVERYDGAIDAGEKGS